MLRARFHRKALLAAPSGAFLLSLLLVSCNPGGGPGGGSEEASAQTATLLVGGPGGGSAGRDVDTSVSDRVTLRGNINCLRDFREWDEALAQGEFQTVVRETEPKVDAGDPTLRTQALLYNSLGRLYSKADPLDVLESLSEARQNEREIIICGDKGSALAAEGIMFAHAALGNFQAAEQELAAVAAIAPAAGDELSGELEELQTADTTTTAPAPSPTPSPAPTPVTPSPSESL
jgi:hypothetical protein